MKVATVMLKSVLGSPFMFGKFYEVEKKAKENHQDYEARTWRERCHVGKDGKVLIPGGMFKKSLAAAAAYEPIKIPGRRNSTYTKNIEAGTSVVGDIHTDVKQTDVEGTWLMVPSDGKRGGGKRVSKCFPTLREWSGKLEFLILDSTVTDDVFFRTLTTAGLFIGVGVWRPRNGGENGRFTIESIVWSGEDTGISLSTMADVDVDVEEEVTSDKS